ncbi:type II toxin-antitoxin system PrlF family antitoxin [Candidatus Binatia bacterium]|nr:type II toxin-antitoxin system PrlF family antitoxin [Candidatus Binatia bacterium]
MAIIEERSTITAKGQTTVPKVVRQVLGIKEGDEIAFRVEGQRVTVVPLGAAREDPVLGKFLAFLARNIEKHPETLKPLSKDFAVRMAALVKGEKVDLDAPIDGDVDL